MHFICVIKTTGVGVSQYLEGKVLVSASSSIGGTLEIAAAQNKSGKKIHVYPMRQTQNQSYVSLESALVMLEVHSSRSPEVVPAT